MKKLWVVLIVLALGAAFLPLWKPVAKKFKWFIVATNIYQDALRRSGLSSVQIGFKQERDPAQAAQDLRHINRTFDSYMEHAALTPAALEGKEVLEIGTGENLGVALRFLAAGARRVVCLEKFVPFQNTPYTRDLYLALREQLPPEQRARFDAAIDLSKEVKPDETRLQYLRRSVEDAEILTRKSSFDLVVSNAVLEEVYDTDTAFAAMDSVLKPGGYSLHKIDLRDYGMFTNQGFHPLEFLTIPDGIYRYMAESVGQPNRRLVDYYRNKMAQLGYQATLFTTAVLARPDLSPHKTVLRRGVDYTDTELDLIRQIRPRLLERYRALPDEDLLVAGIFLMGRKPGP